MSVQFGRWNFEGQPPASDYMEKVTRTIWIEGWLRDLGTVGIVSWTQT
jgi:hypothetical protein